MTYTFHFVKPSPAIWETIMAAHDSSIFFTRQWDDYLHRMGIHTLLMEVRSNEELVGYFVGSRRWLGISWVTAPSMGTGTYAQGLCMLQETTQAERISIYQQLSQHLSKATKPAICRYATINCATPMMHARHYSTKHPYTTILVSPIPSICVHQKKNYGKVCITSHVNTALTKPAKRGCRLDG